MEPGMENKHVTGGIFALGALWSYISAWPWPTISYVIGSVVALVGLLGGFWWQQRKDKREALYWAARAEREAAITAATIAALQAGKVTLVNESVDEEAPR